MCQILEVVTESLVILKLKYFSIEKYIVLMLETVLVLKLFEPISLFQR